MLVDVPPGAVFHSTTAASRSARYAAAAREALSGRAASGSTAAHGLFDASSEAAAPRDHHDDEGDRDEGDADDRDHDDEGADGRSVFTTTTAVPGDAAGAGGGRTAAGSGHAHITLIAPSNWWERSGRFTGLCDFAYGEGWRAATVRAVSRHILAQYAKYAGLSGLRGEAAIASWFSDPLPAPAVSPFVISSAAIAPSTVYDHETQASASISVDTSTGAVAAAGTAPPLLRLASGSSVVRSLVEGADAGEQREGFAAALAGATPAALQALLAPKVVSKATRARARARACADGMLLALRFAWARRGVFASAVNTVAPDLILTSPAASADAAAAAAAASDLGHYSAAAVSSAAGASAGMARLRFPCTSFIADESRGVIELACVHAHVLARRVTARFGWLAAAVLSSAGGTALGASHVPELQPFGALPETRGGDADHVPRGVALGAAHPASAGAGSPAAGWRELSTRAVEVCEELVQPLALAPAITGTEAERGLPAPALTRASDLTTRPHHYDADDAEASSASAVSGAAMSVADSGAAAACATDASGAAVAAQAVVAAEAAVAAAVRAESESTATVRALWPSASSLAAAAEAGGKGSVGDLLQYLYAGRLDLRIDNAQTLLEAADALLLPDARAAAEEFLASHCVHEGSVRGLLELALHRNAPRLASCCAVYANKWNLQMPPHLAWKEPPAAAFAATLAAPVGPAAGSLSSSASAVAAAQLRRPAAAAAAFSPATSVRTGSGVSSASAGSHTAGGLPPHLSAASSDVPGKTSARLGAGESAATGLANATVAAPVFRGHLHHHHDTDNPSGDALDLHDMHDADPGEAEAVAGAAGLVPSGKPAAAASVAASALGASAGTSAPALPKKVWGKPATTGTLATTASAAAVAAAAPVPAVASALATASPWGNRARSLAAPITGSSAAAPVPALAASSAAVPLAASLVGAVDASAFPSLGAVAAAPAALRRSRSGGDQAGVRLYGGATRLGGDLGGFGSGSGDRWHDYHGSDEEEWQHDYADDDIHDAAGIGYHHDHVRDADEDSELRPPQPGLPGSVAADAADADDGSDEDDIGHVAEPAPASLQHHAAPADDPVGDSDTHHDC